MSQAPGRHADMSSCYQRGQQLMSVEKNHDYAHVLFAQCVAHEPSNLSYAQALLENLREKHAGRKRKSTFSLGGNRGLKKAKQAEDWAGVIRLGIDVLKSNPWDVATLRTLAQACAAMHYNEVELVYLKQALDADPKNVDVNRHCALSLGRMGQFDQAIACWHRVESLKGKDEESAKMISQLAEEKLKYPGGRPRWRFIWFDFCQNYERSGASDRSSVAIMPGCDSRVPAARPNCGNSRANQEGRAPEMPRSMRSVTASALPSVGLQRPVGEPARQYAEVRRRLHRSIL